MVLLLCVTTWMHILIFELNSQTNTPLTSVLLQTRASISNISLSHARARVVTYYTEVFSGNVAKSSIFHDLSWVDLCLFPVYRARAVYEH